MDEERKKLLKHWKQKKRGIMKEQLKQYYQNICDTWPDMQTVLSEGKKAGMPEIIKKYKRELAARDCLTMTQNQKNPDLESLKGEVQGKINNIKQKIEEIEAEESKMVESLLSKLKFLKKPEVKRVSGALREIAEVDIAVRQATLDMLIEGEKHAEPFLQDEMKRMVHIFAEENYRRWDAKAERDARKIDLPKEQADLLIFAFLFNQWEKEGCEPDQELNSLFTNVLNLPVEKNLESFVAIAYLTKQEAESVSSYISLAKSHKLEKIVERKTLLKADSPELKVVEEAVEDADEKELAKLEFIEQYKVNFKSRFAEISAIVPADVANKLFEANLKLAVIERKEFDKYLASMRHYVSTNKEAAADIEKNISGFSNPDNIEYLIKSAIPKPAQPIQVTAEQMYELAFRNAGIDFKIVDAIIKNGIKIQKKMIGGAYIPSHVVLNKNLDSYYKEAGNTKETRREVERTFEWLITQGAIIHHARKGKSVKDSTVSINPHINEIQFETLAQYMRDKLGYKNGN